MYKHAILQSVFLADVSGYGLHACFATSGYYDGGQAEERQDILHVEDYTIYEAVGVSELVASNDVKTELLETINREYLAILESRAFTDGGWDKRELEITLVKSGEKKW